MQWPFLDEDPNHQHRVFNAVDVKVFVDIQGTRILHIQGYTAEKTTTSDTEIGVLFCEVGILSLGIGCVLFV